MFTLPVRQVAVPVLVASIHPPPVPRLPPLRVLVRTTSIALVQTLWCNMPPVNRRALALLGTITILPAVRRRVIPALVVTKNAARVPPALTSPRPMAPALVAVVNTLIRLVPPPWVSPLARVPTTNIVPAPM